MMKYVYRMCWLTVQSLLSVKIPPCPLKRAYKYLSKYTNGWRRSGMWCLPHLLPSTDTFVRRRGIDWQVNAIMRHVCLMIDGSL